MRRRSFLRAALALGSAGFSSALARGDGDASADLAQHDLVLSGDRRIARRALVLTPRHVPTGTALPVLVLLHGLGETGNEQLGIRAWSERYGLVTSYARLRRPPLARTLVRARYLSDERLAALNASLKHRPFRGLVLVCPVTPHPRRVGPVGRTLDRYADWIEQTLLPAVRERIPTIGGPAGTGLDGCSLGGYVGMEVFLRKPNVFGVLGGVQAAFGRTAAGRYAERLADTIARVGPRPIHVETSSRDPYREANRFLAERLAELRVPVAYSAPPGPHDQPWLREVGTLEMLLWHDRQLDGLTA